MPKSLKLRFFQLYLFYDLQDHEIWHELIDMKSINLIIKFWEGALTQKARKTFEKFKNGSQNFAFLDTLDVLVQVSPNDLNELCQILPKSSQNLGASSCKILDTCLCFKYSKKIFQKCPKNA